ncbi:MAG: VCBS repeat-containing protein [Burkholderiales bacterium]|nr:VCBS repeat-containing protein [Burkholderiales bacterium]
MDGLLRRAAALAGGILVLASLAALPARAAPGDLDTTFGASGARFWGYAQEELRALKRMADGRLVLAGLARDGGAATLLVVRIGASGTPDATFGTNGIVRLPLGNPDAEIRDMALDPVAGTLVFVGTLNGADNLLVALNGNGAPVLPFGTGGLAQPALPVAGVQRLRRVRFSAAGLVLVAFEAAIAPGVTEDIAIARFDMTGALDASFGSSGVQLAGFACASARATSLAIDTNARPVIAGECLAGASDSDSIVARFTPSGAADAAFNAPGTPGRAVLDFATGARDGIRHLEADGANRLVLAGVTGTAATGLQPFAARLDAAGSADPAYAAGGILALADATGHDITAGVLLANGRLVLEMQRPDATSNRVVASVAPDGSAAAALDLGGTSPGGFWRAGGIVQDGGEVVSAIESGATNSRTWPLSRRDAATLTEAAGPAVVVDPLPALGVALAIANRPGGGYLVAGFAADPTGASRFTVTALTAAGDFDPAFAGGGRLMLGQAGIARAIATYPDGRIVLVGESPAGESVVVRLAANGTLDTTFGTSGVVTMDFSDPGDDVPRAVLVQPDGKIVVGGRSGATGIIVRLNPDGGYDTLFAGQAFVFTGSDIRALALDAEDRIVAAGHWKLGEPRFFYVARFLGSGAADPAFGAGGYFFINFSGIDNEFNAMALMPGGRIAAAGLVRSASPPYQDSRLYRLAPVGELDTFGSGVVLGTGSGADEAFAVAVQGDGKLLVAGHDGDAAYVARLLPVSLAGDAAWGPFGYRTYPGIARAATGIALDPATGNAVLSLEGPDGTQGAMRIVAPSAPNLVVYVRGPVNQAAGAPGTYTITVANQTGSAVNGLTLATTSTGAAGFTHAAPPTTDCPATVSGAVGGSSFSLSGVGAPLAHGQSCTVTLSLAASSTSTGLLEIAPGALVASNGVSNLDVALVQWFVIGPDTTPDPFLFTTAANVAPGSTVTSNTVTITGLGAPAAISVVNGAYSIGCTGTFTSAGGTIANGQSVCVRHVASASYGTQVTTTLTVGGLSADFTSATAVPTRGDANGDGRADLFWRTAAPGTGVSWWTMNGNAMVSNIYHDVGSEWQVADVGDFDGDGKADLVWRRASDGATYLWLLDGLAFKGFADLGVLDPAAWTLVGTGDLNGDGKDDVVWRGADGTVSAWLMNGGTIVSQGVIANPGTVWVIADLADMDGDGRSDIVFRNAADGGVYVFFMNGLTIASGGYVGAVDPALWTLVGAADFSGDGKADLLWRHTSGDTWVWLMNGASFVSAGGIGNPGASWSVRALGDFDGDGKADLAWRHADGTAYLWKMNGAAVSAYLPLANPGGTWQVVAP